MTAALEELGNRLAAYLTLAWGEPVECEDIHQIPGGASRETYRVSIKQAGLSQGIILRTVETGCMLAPRGILRAQ